MDQKAQSNAEYWRRIIDDAESSPLSVREWCKQKGIKPRKFYYWRNRLQELSQVSEAEDVCTSSNSSFVELSIEGEPLSEPQSEPLHDLVASRKNFLPSSAIEPEIRIETPSFKVFVKNGVKEQTLRMVLKVIGDA